MTGRQALPAGRSLAALGLCASLTLLPHPAVAMGPSSPDVGVGAGRSLPVVAGARPLLSGSAAGTGRSLQVAAAAGGRAAGYPVVVYFSRHPDSDLNPAAVFPLRRRSPTLGVAAFAIARLIAGPSRDERRAGYYSPLVGSLSGASTCGGRDFTLALDRRGRAYERGTATLRFCRRALMGGVLDDARVRTEVTATLRQFPAIVRTVILTVRGDCFGDLSGGNRCLRPL